MGGRNWRFFLDVGGTFTDVIAVTPAGAFRTLKLLSSGVVRGRCEVNAGQGFVSDPSRCGEANDLWKGYRVRVGDGDAVFESRVSAFFGDTGRFQLEDALPALLAGDSTYELIGDEEAPVVAIRCLMGLRRDESIGEIEVRLGTTRATNALLERRGARVALVTTSGFADVLKIGYQDRPELFALNIRKRDELTSACVEVDERLDASGRVLRRPDEEAVERMLRALRSDGIEALAVCLLHAHVNSVHEDIVARIATRIGFDQVSVSSRVAPLERIVPRGDTTVADAYLSGVIRQYVEKLRLSLPDARVLLMTSHGGLMAAEGVAGKDTILSGPAGGVVGCARAAEAAGSSRAIGFDMGGTSTDVCRVEPPPARFEYAEETVKAGVRLMTPMLDVETVAAGGGSICGFDGQMLTVGPASAGADPGPACYGRGGPLTVTDVNLYLGRIVADCFPFPLQIKPVKEMLAALAERVRDESGRSLSPTQLALGFLEVANARMAAAIRRISVARGYDLRGYPLCAFGGAAGQHACAIAGKLDMPRVIQNPYAGVLSALGIGAADIKRVGQRAVMCAWGEGALAQLESTVDGLYDELQSALVKDGVAPARISPPSVNFDVCYRGQSTLLTVAGESELAVRGAFEDAHRRLYGYHFPDRPVEVRVVRMELVAAVATPDLPEYPGKKGELVPCRRTRVVFDSGALDVPVYTRTDLRAGDAFVGPAIVIEEIGTIVVDPGWKAEVDAVGNVLLSPVPAWVGSTDEERHRATPAAQTSGARASLQDADPIQLELFRNRFAAIAQRMGETLRRTALSVNVKERLDYSCAVFTSAGELVVNAPHIPVHLGAMSECVKALIEDVGGFTPGDVYVTNDPFRGGSHLNDVTVVTPVHDEAGERLLFFVASRAHHAEIGGTRPGSMPPDSRCLAEEGVLIRTFRWLEAGKPREDAFRELLTTSPYPSRAPDDNLADIAAQVAANHLGLRELRELAERFGAVTVLAYMGHMQRAAENKMRAALRRIPDGAHHFADGMDDGTRIAVCIRVKADEAELDFAGTSSVHPGNLNANRAIVTSAVLYCLRCLINEDIPLNDGVLAPVRIVLPESFLNPPPHADPMQAPATVGGNVETSQRVVDVIFGALGIAAGSQGTMNNLLLGDDTFGYYETICGGAGAGPDYDGADAVHTNMTNTRLTDPEVLEARYPVRLLRFQIRRGSGGRGQHRGGDGVVRELACLRPLDVSILSQRRKMGPYGLAGGAAGAVGRNRVVRVASGEIEELGPIAQITAASGDRIIIETPGGGGYGRAS